MATTGIYKLDDGNYHPTNCFPARSLLRPHYEQGAGHWEVARQAAEQTKIEWLFGSKSTRIKWKGPEILCGTHRHLNEKALTGTLLMKLHHVKSPSHLCSVDISNQNFASAKEEDFEPFDSVAYINATENLLTLEVFRKFPAVRELELSLNGLRNLKVSAGDFPHLEILDLSYNNLSPKDIQALGVLPHLKVLHLTANGLSSLPPDLAVPDSNGAGCPRFPALEVLLLDDNHLSHPNAFVSLANLRSLKQLNLDRNGIKEVPYLHHIENARFSIHPLSAKSGIREGLRTRKSAEIQRKRDAFSGLSEQADSIIMQNSIDPDRTAEILLQSCSPDPSIQGGTPSPRPVSKLSSTSFGQEFVLPLMELRYLSLANNQIEHEEDLLAVALFPSLTELTFYGNPFTTSRSGDPPLLTSFLQDRLGIKLVRKKISKLEKPRIFIPVKANRKVTSLLPKVQKHPPMLEAPHETTFWQLWTGTELSLNTGASLDESEPLPPISQFSAEKQSSVPHLPFREESESELYSAATFPSQDDTLGLVPGVQTSFDDLCGPAHEVPSMLDQILFASLPPHRSFLGGPSQSGLATPTVSPSAEQNPPCSLMPTQERTRPETNTPVGTPSTEQELSQLVAPPSSSGPEANPLERFPPPTAEEDPSQVLQSVSSAGGQPAPPSDLPLEQQALSEPVPPPGSPKGEQDLAASLPLIGSTSVGRDLPETSPPTGAPGQLEPMDFLSYCDQGLNLSENILLGRSPEMNLSGLGLPTGPPLEEQDRLDLAPSHTSLSQRQSLSETALQGVSGGVPPTDSLPFEPGQLEPAPCRVLPPAQDLLEPTSLPRSATEDQDLPPVTTPSAAQDQLESVPLASSSFQAQVLPEPAPPTGSPAREQDLTQPLPPPDEQTGPESSPPSAGQDQKDSLPLAVLTPQEPDRPEAEPLSQSSSTQQEPPKSVLETGSLSSVQGLADGVSGVKPLPEKRVWSSSRDLHLLFEREWSVPSLSREQSDKRNSSDYSMAEQMESFFMTQVAEASDSPETLEKEETPCQEASVEPETKHPPVPKRYKGYEELLEGPTDPDFIEPRGIQQNVKALEWALRHPLVYREPRARLDSFQKPYVPMEKKVLRVPVPPVQKTKAQKLEELLRQMQTPTNIVEVPLVCILRRKKANWREYREALALLQDFRKKYKMTVATASEAKSIQKKQSQTQMLRSLTGVKASGPCRRLPPAPATKDDKGL